MNRLLTLISLLAFGQLAVSHAAPAAKPIPRKAAASQKPPLPAAARPAPGSRPFPDVPPNHWAASAVETLRQRGIVVGYPAAKSSR